MLIGWNSPNGQTTWYGSTQQKAYLSESAQMHKQHNLASMVQLKST